MALSIIQFDDFTNTFATKNIPAAPKAKRPLTLFNFAHFFMPSAT